MTVIHPTDRIHETYASLARLAESEYANIRLAGEAHARLRTVAFLTPERVTVVRVIDGIRESALLEDVLQVWAFDDLESEGTDAIA